MIKFLYGLKPFINEIKGFIQWLKLNTAKNVKDKNKQMRK